MEEESPKASKSKRTKKTKPEKKSKKSKKRAVIEEDTAAGGDNELFGLDTVSSPPTKPLSSFKPLAEDENLVMVSLYNALEPVLVWSPWNLSSLVTLEQSDYGHLSLLRWLGYRDHFG